MKIFLSKNILKKSKSKQKKNNYQQMRLILGDRVMAIAAYREEYLENPTERQKQAFRDFLSKQGLEFEENVELVLRITDEASHEIVGMGCIAGQVLKCIAIDPSRRGEGLSARVISLLVKEQFKRGRDHIFVFTNPKNIEESAGNVFQGFKVVTQTDDIVLLEMGSRDISDYIKELKEKTKTIQPKLQGIVGAIIVNCNPFTYGHQYLIETAAKECDFLFIFVVSEDRSVFPTDIRMHLVQEGTKHLENVMVLNGGEYIISQATFPRYFMKDYDDIVLSQAKLDVKIFAEYIAPALNITRRYVGEEPYCQVTCTYNDAMKEILTPRGIELHVIPRKELKGKAISASSVRQLIRDNRVQETKKLVPETTYDYLHSEKAKPILEKIKSSSSRH
jgi:[citrate (pro-3S)-lyase] ligase